MSAKQRAKNAHRLTERDGLHDCSTCSHCIHNGNKCCGCYDGACCRSNPPVFMSDGDALAEAAAWIAESIGYPVETRMPDHPMPQRLWDALVDHIHADQAGRWHGRQLTREETASWLAGEADRDPGDGYEGCVNLPASTPDGGAD